MSDFERFGRELRQFLTGLLGGPDRGEKVLPGATDEGRTFEENFFYGEVNRFVGSGGEILVKGAKNQRAPATRIDVGDRLIGIGVTHLVESMSRPPGLQSFRASHGPENPSKLALRAFSVTGKEQTPNGFDFTVAPLAPREYSALVEKVSDGSVHIPAETIPEGTMIVSFVASDPSYTLRRVSGSPRANWLAATLGERHWNIGFARPEDFWAASLPSDDIRLLSETPAWVRVGTIRFGLSLLPGSRGAPDLRPVPCIGPSGEATSHQFCLSGFVVGTQGLDTPFPIGLRTEILFHPER